MLETLLEKYFPVAHSNISKSPHTRTPMNKGLGVYVGEEAFVFGREVSV